MADFSLESLDDEGDQAPQQMINNVYCMTKYFKDMTSENRESFIECLLAKVGSVLDMVEVGASEGPYTKAKKDFIKIILFLFLHSVSMVEDVVAEDNAAAEATAAAVSGKGRKKKAAAQTAGGFEWVTLRNACLVTMERVLAVPANYLWAMGSIHENFLSVVWQYIVKVLEAKPIGIRAGTGGYDKEARCRCISIIAVCVKHFGSPESSGSYPNLISCLLESLMRTEHMSAVTAEICQSCTSIITREFLEEISSINESATKAASSGMKNIGVFIEDLAQLNSSTMIANLPLIMKLLDSDAHQVRSSLLAALASIVVLLDKSLKGDANASEAVANAEAEKEEEGHGDAAEADGAEGSTKVADEALGSKGMSPRLRDTILDVIVERTHDVSPYTRGAVLRVWQVLLVANAVPVRRLPHVSEIAFDRLFDKAQAVRKNALSLLTTVMDQNPYGGSLDNLQFSRQKLIFEAKLADRVNTLKNLHLQAQATVSPTLAEAADGETAMSVEEQEKLDGQGGSVAMDAEQGSQTHDGQAPAPAPEVVEDKGEEEEEIEEEEFDMDSFMDSPDVLEDSDVVAIRQGLEYCGSALEVIATLIVACSRVKAMLKSKSTAEVVEALKFITQAVNFSLRGSMQLYFRAADLIFHSDKAIVTEAKNAFKNIFLLHGDAMLPAEEIANNLMEILGQCDASSRTAVEQTVTSLFASDDDSGVDEVAVSGCLWSVVSDADPASAKIGTALRIITLIARDNNEVSMSASRIATVVHHGLASKVISHFNFEAVQMAAQFLQLVPIADHGVLDCETESGKIYASGVNRMVCVILGEMCGDSEQQTSRWFNAAEECIQALFHIHPAADRVLGRIVSSMYATLSSSGVTGGKVACSGARLSRFFFVLGQTALNCLVLADDLTQKNRACKLAAQKAAIATEQSKNKSKKVSDHDAEHDAEMTAAIDMECEQELLITLNQGLLMENLLSKFLPMITTVVASNEAGEASYASAMLRQAATLSLCKFMAVSGLVCEKYLPLLFTALEKTTDAACRTTIMVAMGDLMSRFPNALEQWTTYIYARLCDKHISVRYNALMVLTHMILNDMVKVKGQIVNVLVCLSDPDEKIRDLSKLFFLKLNERSTNPLHNLMGEVISTITMEMSDAERGLCSTSTNSTGTGSSTASGSSHNEVCSSRRVLTSAEYNLTIDFLLTFIKVIKQGDALLERLLPRLALSQTTVQKRALGLCISKLTVSPKGVKKIGEQLKQLKDALCDEEVYEYIFKCVKGTKKSTAVGAATALSAEEKKSCEEVESMLREVGAEVHLKEHEEPSEGQAEAGDADHEAADTAAALEGLQASKENMEGQGQGDAAPTSAPSRRGKAKKTPTKATKAAGKAKGGRQSRRKAVEESDEDEADLEEAPAPRSRRSRRGAPLGEVN